MPRKTYLFSEPHVPTKAAFPVIDAHNHLWGKWDVDNMVKVMDEVGVVSYCDLTANARIAWAGGGYQIQPGDFQEFITNCVHRFPGRFYGFTLATLAAPINRPLFDDMHEFAARTSDLLRQHVRSGARGLKVLKELGLHYRDSKGNQVFADDPGLSPIWRTAAELGVPVLIHQSDPYGFFEPVTPDNEHYDSLKKYPSWSFCDPKFPPKDELIRRRDNLVARERDTTFILPHVANYPENLAYVGTLLEKCPNVHIDFSARMDELGRQPYSARAFFLRYADRILFGTDMPVSAEMYRTYFRFLETFDEGFYPPDYDGTFDRVRWPICGIGLPKDVLAKIYYANALRLIPGLKEDTSGVRFVK